MRLYLGRSISKRFFLGLFSSLIFSLWPGLPLKAAESIEVQFEDMSIPISVKELAGWVEGMSIPNSIKELSEWARDGEKDYSEISAWLNLLDLESRAGLVKILKAPLIKDRSMARQMLRSWVGRQLLDEVSDLVRLDDDRSGRRTFDTLEELLEKQQEVSALDLLEALPAEKIYLDLDALLELASRWRDELKTQQKLVMDLGTYPAKSKEKFEQLKSYKQFPEPKFQLKPFSVFHRPDSITLEIWEPSLGSPQRKSWIVFMPGLGGSQKHFRWLARSLSQNGWPVVVLEHPGSDSKAVQALLKGSRPAPGAEVLPDRLRDLYAVLNAKQNGILGIEGEKVVLMGHSLGALTAFLASGAIPEPGLEMRCKEALAGLSLTNLSQLLQCQMINVELSIDRKIPDLGLIVAINSFGSLLWPNNGGARTIVPVLLAGGTYDLITPARSEQLGLLLATRPNPLSRVLLIEGASHFSPIRVEGQLDNESGDDLFQLGEALVGLQPLSVQELLGSEVIRYIDNYEDSKELGLSFKEKKGDLYFHLFDRSTVNKLLSSQ